MTLELHPKNGNGSTSRHHKVTVSSYMEDAPRVSVVIQDQTMLAGALLDEEQVGMLVKGLLDALEASKAIAASRESQEARLAGLLGSRMAGDSLGPERRAADLAGVDEADVAQRLPPAGSAAGGRARVNQAHGVRPRIAPVGHEDSPGIAGCSDLLHAAATSASARTMSMATRSGACSARPAHLSR